ncbi:hypothetical protein F3Y22_tig00110450pilonHSYRG00553 [Hibiscus syriacus]|uniref:Uncharacterized protein n=1 Tax=Hibiscus syriacus TaxID=106335 RepID=A0A6A3AIX1_HIBSY|nr:hypothetical protein F3Y22_tig00110450pilonHSYRG00553 [Hibiscus syriacus]
MVVDFEMGLVGVGSMVAAEIEGYGGVPHCRLEEAGQMAKKGTNAQFVDDSLGWKLREDGCFTVKSSYKIRLVLVIQLAVAIGILFIVFKQSRLQEFLSKNFSDWLALNLGNARDFIDMIRAPSWKEASNRGTPLFGLD